MEEILEEYKKECALKSKLASLVWKLWMITSLITYFYSAFHGYNTWLVAAGILLLTILIFMVEQIIFLRYVSKKLEINYSFRDGFDLKKMKKIYSKIESFQKNWITNFCKKKKIDTFNKLNLILTELKIKKEKATTKYVEWGLVSSIVLSLLQNWINDASDEMNLINKLVMGLIVAVIISFLVNFLKNNTKKFKKFFLEPDLYSNIERLEELIFYKIMKSKK